MDYKKRTIIKDDKLRTVVSVLLVIFPIASNLITHACSTIFVLLAVMGLSVVLFSRARYYLTQSEKWIAWSFVAYFAVHFFSYVINWFIGDIPDFRPKLDHEGRWLLFFPIYAIFRYCRVSPKVLWAGLLAGAFFSGFYAIALWAGSPTEVRVSGSYHAIAFGDLALTFAFMCIPSVSWFAGKKIFYLLIPMTAFFSGIIACIYSGTRGAWIAIPMLSLIIYFYFATSLTPRVRYILLTGCFLLGLAAYHHPITNIENRVNAGISEIVAYSKGNQEYTSTTTRLVGWRASLDIFYDNPVIGAGPGQYELLLHQLVAQGKSYEIAGKHSQPHSTYMITMAECGTVGLLALLGIFASPLYAAFRLIRSCSAARSFGYALAVLIVAFMHFGLTETIFSRNVFIGFYIVFVAALLAIEQNVSTTGSGA